MFAMHPTTRRKFSAAVATVSLVALGLSGCGWAENYAKPIYVGRVKASRQEAGTRVSGSFFTAEEKKVAVEQLDRIQSAYLGKIEMKMGEKTAREAGGWNYDAASGDRLLVVAQVRALRDDYLPPSGLSDGEKKRGVKTCDAAICALVAHKLPLDLSRTPPNRNLLVLAMQLPLWRLRNEASAADGKAEEAAQTPPAEREARPKRPGKVVDPDAEVRQALAVLEDALAHAREKTTFVIPEGPCQIDLAVEIREGVEAFLKKLGAN